MMRVLIEDLEVTLRDSLKTPELDILEPATGKVRTAGERIPEDTLKFPGK